jgi:hypothetical protein
MYLLNVMKVLGDRAWLIVPLPAVLPCADQGHVPDVCQRRQHVWKSCYIVNYVHKQPNSRMVWYLTQYA